MDEKTLYSVHFAGVLIAVCTTSESANKIRKQIADEEELDDENLVEIYPVIPDVMIE